MCVAKEHLFNDNISLVELPRTNYYQDLQHTHKRTNNHEYFTQNTLMQTHTVTHTHTQKRIYTCTHNLHTLYTHTNTYKHTLLNTHTYTHIYTQQQMIF